eukprot:GGOE01040687.1.p1 GENE.GGOE01040687.1~~GGOE01040687.1.p1  ORF type:complete len:630 (-),score=171.15 GGOE01040687.1:35-1870(-)
MPQRWWAFLGGLPVLLAALVFYIVSSRQSGKYTMYTKESMVSALRSIRMWDPAGAAGQAGEVQLPHGLVVGPTTSIIAINCHVHSASLAVSVGGRLQVVVGLDRIFGIPNYGSSYERGKFQAEWTAALALARQFHQARYFDVGVVVGGKAIMKNAQRLDWAYEQLHALIPARAWVDVPHHLAHAAHGFYDSGFQQALIVSADGGGDDLPFNVYLGSRVDGIKTLHNSPLNIGHAYMTAAMVLPALRGLRVPDCQRERHLCSVLPSALMSLASYGSPSGNYRPLLELLFSINRSTTGVEAQLTNLKLSMKEQQNFAATAQVLLEDELVRQIKRHYSALQAVDGIVLTGGVALNARSNSVVRSRLGKRVYVTSAPGDDGVAIGGAWLIQPPLKLPSQDLQFLGAFPKDVNELPYFTTQLKARLAKVPDVAQVLASGEIVAVLRGRQETGPRALGHRSLLAIPTANIGAQLNKYRKAAPFIPLAAVLPVEWVADLVVEKDFTSPHMSFLATVRPQHHARCPAVLYPDGTTLLQVVSAVQEPWLHALLLAVGEKTGLPLLVNTAFREEGRPIINSIKDAIKFLTKRRVVKHLLVDDFLFSESLAIEGSQPLRWNR